MNSQLSLGLDIEKVSRPLLLISLHEEPYNKIRDGSKVYEFRRRFTNQPVDAFVWVSSPVKILGGYIKFGQPIYEDPEFIARLGVETCGSDYDSMISYFKGLDKAFALPVKEFIDIEPISLAEMREVVTNFYPPQLYLDINKNKVLSCFLKSRYPSLDCFY